MEKVNIKCYLEGRERILQRGSVYTEAKYTIRMSKGKAERLSYWFWNNKASLAVQRQGRNKEL